MSNQNMQDLVKEINQLKGCVVPKQRGRRIQFAMFEKGHAYAAPQGWVQVHIGTSKSRNVLSLSRGAALEFIEQVRRHNP